MSIPAEGYPAAAAVSPRLQVIETVDSTNAKLLRDAAADPEAFPHLSVLLTRDQRAGRGRLDRTWTTPPGSALAVSVLLRVGAVGHAARGWIPLAAGAALVEAVDTQLRDLSVTLKWPNDVLVEGQKIAGILAEVEPTDPEVVVVGVGVNTTMDAAEIPVATATSFAALGRTADEDRLLADYLTGLRDRIAELAVRGPLAIADDIAKRCATLGKEVAVSLPDDTTLTGTAVRLDEDGRLVVDGGAGEVAVSAGDVVHVR